MSVLNTAHETADAVISLVDYRDAASAQRVDIIQETDIALTKWGYDAGLGVEGPTASGLETAASVDTSGYASNKRSYSIGLVCNIRTYPGFGSAGESEPMRFGPLYFRAWGGNVYGRYEAYETSYAVATDTEVALVFTSDGLHNEFGTIDLWVDGVQVDTDAAAFLSGDAPVSVLSRGDATDGDILKIMEVVWDRVLTDPEIAAWSADPYDLFGSTVAAPLNISDGLMSFWP